MTLTAHRRRPLTYKGTGLWNSLRDDMKESPSLHKVKESYTQYLLAKQGHSVS